MDTFVVPVGIIEKLPKTNKPYSEAEAMLLMIHDKQFKIKRSEREYCKIFNWTRWAFQRFSNQKPTTFQPSKTSKNGDSRKKTNQKPTKNQPLSKITLTDIEAYIKDNNLKVDAEMYYNSRKATNWIKANGQQVMNWKNDLRYAEASGSFRKQQHTVFE